MDSCALWIVGRGSGRCWNADYARIPATNYIDAVATGILSGISATGVHQIYKQLWSKKPPGVSLTWDEYQADKGKITFPANEDETTNGQS